MRINSLRNSELLSVRSFRSSQYLLSKMMVDANFIVSRKRVAGPGGDVRANNLSSVSFNACFAQKERHFANAVEHLCL